MSTSSSNTTEIFPFPSTEASSEYWINPRWNQLMVLGWDDPPPLWLIKGFYQSLRAGEWEELVFMWWNWSSQDKVLYKRRPTKIKYLTCPRSEHKINLQEAYRCQETTHLENWSPWRRYTPDKPLNFSSFIIPWPLIGFPLTWDWPQPPRCQTGGVRSVPPLTRILW